MKNKNIKTVFPLFESTSLPDFGDTVEYVEYDAISEHMSSNKAYGIYSFKHSIIKGIIKEKYKNASFNLDNFLTDNISCWLSNRHVKLVLIEKKFKNE